MTENELSEPRLSEPRLSEPRLSEPRLPEPTLPEPWLRATLMEVPAVPRAVLHALQMANEDLGRWCGGLSDEELNSRPAGIAPVAFHLRHIARSLDRLLTYAEGNPLTADQLAALKTESDPASTGTELFAELALAIENSVARVRAFKATELEQARGIGKKQLPTSVGGLLVHVADHTQRHVGQAITTAKVVLASRKQT
jgi:uncharacterized damage-inducible protein DinB